MKYLVNDDGKKVIALFDKGIKELRRLIKIGDIDGLSSNFQNVGAAGMRRLKEATNNQCLQGVFRAIAELDKNIAEQLAQIESPYDAGVIVCVILKYKAKEINYCVDEEN